MYPNERGEEVVYFSTVPSLSPSVTPPLTFIDLTSEYQRLSVFVFVHDIDSNRRTVNPDKQVGR